MVRLNPKRIAIGPGYHGSHGVVSLMKRLTGLQVIELDTLLSRPMSEVVASSSLTTGDLIHVETPINPTGEARNLAAFIALGKELGCYVSVDATFAPPPLQDPLSMGADVAMHSGTKYLGGHSDMLCGVLVVNPKRAQEKEGTLTLAALRADRLLLGAVMGNLEGWLGVRSIRTLELRVTQQSASAKKLVAWLTKNLAREGGEDENASVIKKTVARVQHASLQREGWLAEQMPGGFGPVFSITLTHEQFARSLPSKLHLFHHATSLGGVESLVEWRAISDRSVDPRLIRVSVGVEAWEDLKEDLARGLAALLKDVTSATE